MPYLLIALAIAITIGAGLIEAYGYTLSFRAISEQQPGLFLMSFMFYGMGIAVDYAALMLMSKTPFFIPEIMSTIFMVSTIIGIAILSGQFFHWKPTDQTVGVLIVLGLAWLCYRVE